MERTEAYRFTVDRLDHPMLVALREEVSALNRHRDGGPRQVVNVQGRLGKDSPNADNPRLRRRGYAGPQRVPLDLASRFDVYVHRRYDTPKDDPTPVVVRAARLYPLNDARSTLFIVREELKRLVHVVDECLALP